MDDLSPIPQLRQRLEDAMADPETPVILPITVTVDGANVQFRVELHDDGTWSWVTE